VISYCITDPSYYSDSTEKFSLYIEEIFQSHKVDMISFRDKRGINLEPFIKIFLDICKKYNTPALINSHIDLALKYNFFGVHLTSSQFNKISYAHNKKLFVIVSTHSLEEAKLAQKYGASLITFSPIFHSPNKGKPKGLEALKEVVDNLDIGCIALGGIMSQKEIDSCQKAGSYGFASIRFFANKV